MNVVDDFFRAPDWPTTFAIVHERCHEFHSDESGTILARYRDRLAGSDIGKQIFNMYLEILQTGVGQGLHAMVQLLESIGMMPKLVDRDVDLFGAASDVELFAAATDAAAARPLWEENPAMATALLANQSLFGDAFWFLLAAGVRRVDDGTGVGTSTAGEAIRSTVVVEEAGALRRVLKVLPLSDGGLAVTTPYHAARDGFLFKSPRMRGAGTRMLDPGDLIPFNANDRVKLSYHVDGFAQFSGEDNARIVSGRDRDTGMPKGLGLVTNPLEDPLTSGPSVGCTIWGLGDFEDWKPKRGDQALVFREDDFYVEPDQSPDGILGYSFSMFMIPSAALRDAIGEYGSGTLVELSLPMRVGAREHRFRARLVVLGGPVTCVVLAERNALGFLEPSGFTLSGPGDAEGTLMAFYPRPNIADLGTNLDRPG